MKQLNSKVSIANEHFESVIKYFEFLGKDVLLSKNFSWKISDPQEKLTKELLQQFNKAVLG